MAHIPQRTVQIFVIVIHVLYNFLLDYHLKITLYIQSNLSNVTFQGISEIWSHKTGGRLIQV